MPHLHSDNPRIHSASGNYFHQLPQRTHVGSCARWLAASLLLSLFFHSGCVHRRIARELPTRPTPPFSDSGMEAAPERWWTAFGDPMLNLQVEQALGGNFALGAAVQRLNATRALVRREASDLFPQVDGVYALDGTFGPGRDRGNIVWGLDASYQVDLWGRIHSRVDAERFRAEATAADYQTVALTLSAEVARAWYALIEARAQLELLEDQLKTNEEGVKSLELRFGRGFVLSPDVLRQRQLVQSTLEQMVVEKSRIEVLEHRVAVLQGQPPQLAQFETGSILPDLPSLPATGLPSDLLLRRPDVRREYLAFAAADRDLASAISAQYPRINLTGSVVNAAANPETLFRDWFVSIGAQLIGPIIDGGRRRAEVDRNAAVVGQRFNEYGETMLNAFREVEDNLARERYQVERIERLGAQVQLAQQASQQLKAQYATGEADYLDLLSTIQAEQRLQREILSARLDLVLIRIGLYLALAGGFDTQPLTQLNMEPPTTPTTTTTAPTDSLKPSPATRTAPTAPSQPPGQPPRPSPRFHPDGKLLPPHIEKLPQPTGAI